MIGKLTGILDTIEDDWIILDVNGVGYSVFLSERTRANLPQLGSLVKLFIETHVREDHIRLYGFLSLAEQEWFQILQKVQGVGVKIALTVLSTLSHDTLTEAIIAEDHTRLTQTPGIGPKVAARIVRELKDKIPAFSPTRLEGNAPFLKIEEKESSAQQSSDKEPPLLMEALSALVNLGYSSFDAQLALRTALAKKSTHPPYTLEELIHSSLRYCIRTK